MKTDLEKYVQIFEQFLCHAQNDGSSSLNHLKLMKLVWAADRFHLRQFGRTVSGDTYVAMKNGPVASDGLDVIRESGTGYPALSPSQRQFVEEFIEFKNYEVSLKSSCGDDLLSPSEKIMIQKSWDTFKGFDPFYLANTITHKYPEWSKFEEFFECQPKSHQAMSLEDFFLDPEHDPYFAQDKQTLEAAQDIFALNHS